MNNLLLRIGISGPKLSTWPLDPNSSLQYHWVAGYNIHTNQQSTFPMTQLWISFTNQATMLYGMFSPNSLMPWLPIASCTTCTPGLPPLFPPWPTTLPLHPQAQSRCSIFRALVYSPSPLHLLHPVWPHHLPMEGLGMAIAFLGFPRQWSGSS